MFTRNGGYSIIMAPIIGMHQQRAARDIITVCSSMFNGARSARIISGWHVISASARINAKLLEPITCITMIHWSDIMLQRYQHTTTVIWRVPFMISSAAAAPPVALATSRRSRTNCFFRTRRVFVCLIYSMQPHCKDDQTVLPVAAIDRQMMMVYQVVIV